MTKKLFYILLLLLSFNCFSAIKRDTHIVFGHGLNGDYVHGKFYKKKGMFKNCKLTDFHFSDSKFLKGNWGMLNIRKISLGQKNETDIFEGEYRKVFKSKSEKDTVIVAGVSRGGINVFTGIFLGANGLFAEAPAAHLKDIINYQCKRLAIGCVPGLSWFIHRWIAPYFMFGKYKPGGPQPIDQIHNSSKETPKFISFGYDDTLIPASSSVRLAEALVRAGHKKVYTWGVDSSSHARILDSKHATRYKRIFHAFLKECGASHDATLAQEGQEELRESKLSLDQLTKLRKKLEWDNCKKYVCRNIITLLCGTYFVKKLINNFCEQ